MSNLKSKIFKRLRLRPGIYGENDLIIGFHKDGLIIKCPKPYSREEFEAFKSGYLLGRDG